MVDIQWTKNGTQGSSALEWLWRGAATAIAQSKGREKRERKREGKRSVWTVILTTIFLPNFHSNLKKFQYESCSKFQILQLSFQAHFHLKLLLKVKIWNLKVTKNSLHSLYFKIFSKFCMATWKTLNMKVVCHIKLYNFGFRQKFI